MWLAFWRPISLACKTALPPTTTGLFFGASQPHWLIIIHLGRNVFFLRYPFFTFEKAIFLYLLELLCFSAQVVLAPNEISLFQVELGGWVTAGQMIFIYRATRIFIKFYSKTFGRVTAAHWKWVKICTFALSVPPVCTEILSYLLLLNFSPSRSYFLTIFCCEGTYYNLSSFQNLYQLLSYLENWACQT